ncbi:hypothetical protein QBC44DRAFT_342088 [Cladorrhinum sp. PSN332]|nr:hypothetical protein QBC44DRAFT_342088 [Cladorrhinum sp. PSN332]
MVPAMHSTSNSHRPWTVNLPDPTHQVIVAWEDSNQQVQYTRNLDMDLYVSVSENQALFALHCLVFCTGSTPDRRIYLFVPPENVKSIESQHTHPSLPLAEQPDTFIPLRFSMTKPPSFEIPTAPFKPKPRSMNLVATTTALASVQDFTIYFNRLSFTPDIQKQLSSLPSIFSTSDLKTLEGQDSIKHLYRHPDSKEIKAPSPGPSSNTSIKETVEESSPPPYIEAQPNRKRQRTSESLSPSIDKRILLAFDQVAQRIDRLEKRAPESIAPTPCRYSTEEMEHIISHVNDRIDDQLTGIHIELEEKVTEGTEQLVVEKTEETQEQFWNGIREELVEEMREEVKQELKKLMVEMKTELFRDMARAMMSAAYGGNEKAMSLGAGTQSSESTH